MPEEVEEPLGEPEKRPEVEEEEPIPEPEEPTPEPKEETPEEPVVEEALPEPEELPTDVIDELPVVEDPSVPEPEPLPADIIIEDTEVVVEEPKVPIIEEFNFTEPYDDVIEEVIENSMPPDVVIATIEIPATGETVEIMPNGTVINEETGEFEDYSADFSYDYDTGTIVPEVPGGDNETVDFEVDMPDPEVINKTEGTEVFMTYSYSYSRVYSYSYSWKNKYQHEMYSKYYSYSYPIGGQYAHGHYHYFYGNGTVMSEDGVEEDIDFDYSYDETTGEIVMEMPGGDNTTLLSNGTEEIPEPVISPPEIVVTEEIVPVEVEIPEPVMTVTYSYSYSKDYSYEVYGYMYSYYYSYSRRIGRQMGKDGHWHNMYANGTVTNDDGEPEDYSIDYSYDYSTDEITVDLGDEGVGEPEEEMPEEMVDTIAPPETTVVETLTPVIPEEPVEAGEPIQLPDEKEEDAMASCDAIPRPEYNYTYSYDTSY